MHRKELINTDLKLRIGYWDGQLKNERIFLAKEMMTQLGYKGGNDTLKNYELVEGIDKVTLKKKEFPKFFKELTDLKSVGQRTGTVILLYESGVWKLIMQSRKQVGIKTRNWLAREVLPSIHTKGYYDVKESELNPLSYLNEFTERKKQLDNSKKVNTEISHTTKDYASYHNQVHKLVNGMTAKEMQDFFKSKESAREITRQNIPENASTIALIDEIFTQYHRTLEEIERTGIHLSAKETFKALYDLGIKPIM
jgi:prophage antirepressor-like protein